MKTIALITPGFFTVAAFFALCSITTYSQRLSSAVPSPFGVIVGRVEIVPGIAATSDFVPRVSTTGNLDGFRVLVEGLVSGTRCDQYGNFELRRVPTGTRTIVVLPPGFDRESDPELTSLPHKKVGVMSGETVDVGTLIVTRPGSVTGRIIIDGSTSVDMASLVIAIPQFGLVTKPNPDGGYLLTGVPPGTWNVLLKGPGIRDSRETLRLTYIAAMNPTLGVDFIIRGSNGTGSAAAESDPSVITPNNQQTEKQKPAEDTARPAKGTEKTSDAKKPSTVEKTRSTVKSILETLPKKP